MTVIEIIALIIGVLVAFRVVQFIAARAVGMLKTDQELIDEEKREPGVKP